MEARDVIVRFVLTEKAMREMEENNRLTVVVRPEATKADIKKVFEETFGVKVKKVNVLRTPKGEKKAYVRLSEEYSATKLAEDLGIM